MRFIERDWLSANGILFDDGTRTALVDTGYVKHRDLTLAVVRRALSERPLDLLVNTHLHSDHCGGNAILQAHYGVRTLVPAASVDAVRAWDEDALTFAATGQRCDRFVCDGALDDGQTIELGGLSWQALAAPGHDPQALILHCAAERVLISADALWGSGFGVIFPELEGESGFAEQRAILERIESLDVAVVIPGHGPMFTDVRGALRTAHQRLEYLSADPARNALQAVKVLLKFLLLEHERVPLEGVGPLLASIPLTTNANARYIGMAPDALTDWAIAGLLKAGAARIDGDALVNA
ncbi:MAG: MBL fold metallo-hydrolase [Burkholderiales bacterium]|nr:MAG: MBL fold metallo-hydrolase [Burkholderiales bacterium]